MLKERAIKLLIGSEWWFCPLFRRSWHQKIRSVQIVGARRFMVARQGD